MPYLRWGRALLKVSLILRFLVHTMRHEGVIVYTADVQICNTPPPVRLSLTLLDEFIVKRVRLGVVIFHKFSAQMLGLLINFFQNVVKLVKFL